MQYNSEAMQWLLQVVPELKKSPAYQKWLLSECWRKIVGNSLASQSYVGKWEQGVLTIYSENPILMHQLFIQKKQFIQKWIAAFPNIPLHDLICKPGRPQVEEKPIETKKEREQPWTELPQETIRQIIKAFHKIEPKSLRKALIKARIHHAHLEQNRRNAGWKACPNCGALTDCPDGICDICRQQIRQKKQSRLLQYLLEHGNEPYEKVYRAVPCTEQEYETARYYLLGRLRDRIFWRQDSEQEREQYVRLKWRLPDTQYTPEWIEKEIRKLPRCEENKQK